MNLFGKRKAALSEKRRLEKRESLRKDIEKLEEDMLRTETVFNLTTDEFLLESAIYEQNAQRARMSYLLRLAKEI